MTHRALRGPRRKMYLKGLWVAARLVPLIMGGPVLAGDWLVNNPKTDLELKLNQAAKVFCSARFVSRFTPAVIQQQVIDGNVVFAGEQLRASVADARVDESTGIVELRSGAYRGRARYYGDQGCVLLPDFRDEAFFTPKVVRNVLRPSMVPWVDGRPGHGRAAAVDKEILRRAGDLAIGGDSHGAAFVVVHRGRLLLERYGEGVTTDTPLHNWSMGKSIIGTLVGMLVQQRRLTVDEPAPIAEWHQYPDDPRQRITIRNLMQMSSGLLCGEVKQWQVFGEIDDHARIYSEPLDVLRYAILRPTIHAPNSAGSYSNCDMQSLGMVLRRSIESAGEDYLAWPYRNLYDPIGMVGMVSEVDTYGSFHLTGYDYGTARDWARLGQLYLNDGLWNGRHILPPGWTKFVSTPAPAWQSQPESYGATFWVNSKHNLPIPVDAFMAKGFQGNTLIVIPSQDLLIVLLRHPPGSDEVKDANLRQILTLLESALHN
jgi:CubicO group peptidase (beta-lactamase class C family)